MDFNVQTRPVKMNVQDQVDPFQPRNLAEVALGMDLAADIPMLKRLSPPSTVNEKTGSKSSCVRSNRT